MDDEAILSSDVVRAEEENPVIVVTARVKSIFENSSVRVVQFKDWMSCILVFRELLSA
ncbi:hypothetical protein PPUJ20005_53590 [Pseudomonas putida]|nr:hypothetical protein PPUJ20005_53590 [Pseudomonas putida]